MPAACPPAVRPPARPPACLSARLLASLPACLRLAIVRAPSVAMVVIAVHPFAAHGCECLHAHQSPLLSACSSVRPACVRRCAHADGCTDTHACAPQLLAVLTESGRLVFVSVLTLQVPLMLLRPHLVSAAAPAARVCAVSVRALVTAQQRTVITCVGFGVSFCLYFASLSGAHSACLPDCLAVFLPACMPACLPACLPAACPLSRLRLRV